MGRRLSDRRCLISRVSQGIFPTSDLLPPSNRLMSNQPKDDDSIALPRRDFIKVAGAGAGALLIGGTAAEGATPGPKATRSVRSASASPEIVVIGAGLWGSVTA